nr:hypothetical protein KK1_035922 [Ipomoea trifida]
MATTPFLPSFIPSNLNNPASLLLSFSFRRLAKSSSFEMIAAAGFQEVNRVSFFRQGSSNNLDKSKPGEKEMISNAFKFDNLAPSCLLSSPGHLNRNQKSSNSRPRLRVNFQVSDPGDRHLCCGRNRQRLSTAENTSMQHPALAFP